VSGLGRGDGARATVAPMPLRIVGDDAEFVERRIHAEQMALALDDQQGLPFDTWTEDQWRQHGEIVLGFHRSALKTVKRQERQNELNGWVLIAAKMVALIGAGVTVVVTATGGTVASIAPSPTVLLGAVVGGGIGTQLVSHGLAKWRARRSGI
jgi:hypothetical protein